MFLKKLFKPTTCIVTIDFILQPSPKKTIYGLTIKASKFSCNIWLINSSEANLTISTLPRLNATQILLRIL